MKNVVLIERMQFISKNTRCYIQKCNLAAGYKVKREKLSKKTGNQYEYAFYCKNCVKTIDGYAEYSNAQIEKSTQASEKE